MSEEQKTNEQKLDNYINQIINADCLDILRQLPDKCIDLVLTDPPYGSGGDFEQRKRSRFGGRFDKYHIENRRHLGEQVPPRGCL